MSASTDRLRRAPQRAWFASDFHLAAQDPEGVARACRFVEHVRAQAADALFLLGDVFRAWLGARSLQDPGLKPFFDALKSASEGGIRVVIIHGNHDFLMGPELERACGLEVYEQNLDISVRGQVLRLLHGDAFCTNDESYHKLHGVLRHPAMRWVFRTIPASSLAWVGDRLVHGATRATGEKSQASMAIVDEEVVRAFETGPDLILCGHVHVARDERIGSGEGAGRLVVMADFERSGCHAHMIDGELTLVREDVRFGCHGEVAGRAPIVVTLDGPAGSGKSSVSRQLAERLGFVMLDSGALYRTVTALGIEAGLALDADGAEWGALAAGLDLAVGSQGEVLLDGVPVEDARLRSAAVSAAVSAASAHPEVRHALLEVQRQAAGVGAGLVAEGRDMATVVFPEAVVQVYLDARPEVRARRRLAQNPGEGETVDQVVAALEARDWRDSQREHAPLSRASGARLLDTSDLSQAEVLDELEKLVQQAAEAPRPDRSQG